VHLGAAVSTRDLHDASYARAIRRDCTILSAEYEMKWDAVEGPASQEGGSYGPADEITAFAGAHGLAVHGHTLWWHEAVPRHLVGAASARFADAALGHVRRMVSRYAGHVLSWDVVNEPLAQGEEKPDNLRSSPFLAAFGPDYIGLAYRAAAAADPNALMVLNEMGLEYASDGAERKRRAMLKLLERELAAGTPIGCLGIQSHLEAGPQSPAHPGLRQFLKEVRGMGLPVMITELDVADHACPRDRRSRDWSVADVYRAYLAWVLEEVDVRAIITWGFTDRRTWLSGYRPRPDGAPVRPLPLDAALRRKPAWHAIAGVLLRPTDRKNADSL
jgi:endo-1,4-beta-xylanase